MHITLVHSFYRSENPSGENEMVAYQADALRRRGHGVSLITRDSDEHVVGPVGAARAAWTVASGQGYDPSGRLAELRPDVVHVHNLFPSFGTRWLAESPFPVVATLHNYRPLCANGLLLRDGQVCTRCPDGERWAGLRFGCYRDSRIATAPLAWANRRPAAQQPLLRRADAVIVLSGVARQVYERVGLRRLRLLPNAVPDAPPRQPSDQQPSDPQSHPVSGDRAVWVVVGRLTAEKGVAELLAEWPAGRRLDIVGDGPLLDQLRAAAPAGVRFLGLLDRDEVRQRLPGYAGLIHPGIALEGAYPLSIVEAWSGGLPVVVRPGGGAEEMVSRWGAGVVWDERTPLTEALNRAERIDPAAPRGAYDANFTEDRWVAALEALYEEVRAGHGAAAT